SFNNYGSIVHSGTANWSLAIPIENQLGGVVEVQSTGGFAGASRVDNFGTFRKSTNAGTATMVAELRQKNVGPVEGSAGTLSLTNVANNTTTTMPNGTWKVLNGSTLNFPTAGSNVTTISGSTFVTLSGAGASINKLPSGSLTAMSGSLTLLNGATLTAGNFGLQFSANGGTLYVGAGSTFTAAGFTQSNSIASQPILTVEIGGTTAANYGRVVSTAGITLNNTSSTLNAKLVNG